MAVTTEEFLEQFRRLMPPGQAWDFRPDSTTEKFLGAFAEEASEINGRVEGLFPEAIPSTTSELLTDWEETCGLPDPCLGDTSQSVGERRQAVINKLRRPTGQTPQFYIDLAASYGFDIEIIESCPFRAGQSSAGDAITNPTSYAFECGFSCSGQALDNYDVGWVYYWTVVTSEFANNWFESGSGASGDPIRTFGNEVLECALNASKPAHTKIIFRFE